jgi:hypothetical protein
MALTFDADKDKKISMMVETSGIEDKSILNFTFNIIVEGIKYGFSCHLEEDKVKINIPALSSIINDLKTGKYLASLDVTGDSKCFLQPFKEEISIVKNPKMNVINNMVEEIGASISRIIDEDILDIVADNINKSVVKESPKPDKIIKVGKVDKIFG